MNYCKASVALLLLLSACGSRPIDFTDTSTITLQTGSGFCAACVSSTVTVHGDGTVVLEAQFSNGAEKRGDRKLETKIDRNRVSALVAAFREADFLGLDDRYPKFDIVDAGSSSISIHTDTIEKSVVTVGFDESTPKKIGELQKKISDLIDADSLLAKWQAEILK
jgi:hypothetical protein